MEIYRVNVGKYHFSKEFSDQDWCFGLKINLTLIISTFVLPKQKLLNHFDPFFSYLICLMFMSSIVSQAFICWRHLSSLGFLLGTGSHDIYTCVLIQCRFGKLVTFWVRVSLQYACIEFMFGLNCPAQYWSLKCKNIKLQRQRQRAAQSCIFWVEILLVPILFIVNGGRVMAPFV